MLSNGCTVSKLFKAFGTVYFFSMQNLWRMRQLYEIYKDYPKLPPLVTVLVEVSKLLTLKNLKQVVFLVQKNV